MEFIVWNRGGAKEGVVHLNNKYFFKPNLVEPALLKSVCNRYKRFCLLSEQKGRVEQMAESAYLQLSSLSQLKKNTAYLARINNDSRLG